MPLRQQLLFFLAFSMGQHAPSEWGSRDRPVSVSGSKVKYTAYTPGPNSDVYFDK